MAASLSLPRVMSFRGPRGKPTLCRCSMNAPRLAPRDDCPHVRCRRPLDRRDGTTVGHDALSTKAQTCWTVRSPGSGRKRGGYGTTRLGLLAFALIAAGVDAPVVSGLAARAWSWACAITCTDVRFYGGLPTCRQGPGSHFRRGRLPRRCVRGDAVGGGVLRSSSPCS